MLFCLFFFLKEGRSIWLWCVPAARARPRSRPRERDLRLLRAYADPGGGHRRDRYRAGRVRACPLAILIGVITFFCRVRAHSGRPDVRRHHGARGGRERWLRAMIIMLVIIVVVGQVTRQPAASRCRTPSPCTPSPSCLVITAGFAIAGIAGAIFSVPIAVPLTRPSYRIGYDPMPELATAEDRPRLSWCP